MRCRVDASTQVRHHADKFFCGVLVMPTVTNAALSRIVNLLSGSCSRFFLQTLDQLKGGKVVAKSLELSSPSLCTARVTHEAAPLL